MHSMLAPSTAADEALLDLLRRLKSAGYHFVTPTPDTHARIVARADKRRARNLRDVLGWSLPFERDLIDPAIVAALEKADAIGCRDGLLRSALRVSSLQGDLYLHSAYPTTARDAVFFGPDSYRFADLVRRELRRARLPARPYIVDIGTGAGVGAIVAGRTCPGARITMTDINGNALRFAVLNAAAANVEADAVRDAGLGDIADPIDIALANPPYIIDEAGRSYRDGGEMHGAAVALEMARSALSRLAAGGRLILYTGSAIVDGADAFREVLGQLAERAGCAMRYREIDPDMFGEELSRPEYGRVERIAIVAAIIERPHDG